MKKILIMAAVFSFMGLHAINAQALETKSQTGNSLHSMQDSKNKAERKSEMQSEQRQDREKQRMKSQERTRTEKRHENSKMKGDKNKMHSEKKVSKKDGAPRKDGKSRNKMIKAQPERVKAKDNRN